MKMQECKYKGLYDILKEYQSIATGCAWDFADYCFEDAITEMCRNCEQLNVSGLVRTYFMRKLYKAQYECCKRFNWVASPSTVKSELK